MLDRSLRILNFDDSLTQQKKVLSAFPAEVINCKDLGPKVRFWMDKQSRIQIAERLKGSSRNSPTFIGSGDFHHISSILMDQFTEDFSLIVFDFHPDWDILPPRMGCGSWVTQSLKRKNILKVILAGVSSCDISTWSIQTANLSSLGSNRLEIYPYAHLSTRVFLRKIPENNSVVIKKFFGGAKIYWQELRKQNLGAFFLSVLKRLPAKPVYLSIDKDCLKKEDACTNWEEGLLSLGELLEMLRLIKENLGIIGMDITGDYSEIAIKGRFKSLISRLDHPKDTSAQHCPGSSITAINEKTNLEILKTVLG